MLHSSNYSELTVVPIGGLCNRFRALFSAWFLAEKHPELKVRVKWGINKECNASFERLFELPKKMPFTLCTTNAWDIPALKRNLYLPRLLRSFYYDRQFFELTTSEFPALLEHIVSNRRIWICTGSSFADYPSSYPRLLRPNEELREKIELIANNFDNNTIGVHIRRTDNEISKATASVNAYRKAMYMEIEREPATRFFLATDDADCKESLCKEFGARVMVQEAANLHRDAEYGIKCAVVDLFCLAATRKLLGSHWSSFTDTAAELGNMPVLIVRSEDFQC